MDGRLPAISGLFIFHIPSSRLRDEQPRQLLHPLFQTFSLPLDPPWVFIETASDENRGAEDLSNRLVLLEVDDLDAVIREVNLEPTFWTRSLILQPTLYAHVLMLGVVHFGVISYGPTTSLTWLLRHRLPSWTMVFPSS